MSLSVRHGKCSPTPTRLLSGLCHRSGQIEETVDGLAYIGPNPFDEENIYIATGDSGMGTTHICDLILERENPWAKLYDPSRKKVSSLKEWVKGNFTTALQYRNYLTNKRRR